MEINSLAEEERWIQDAAKGNTFAFEKLIMKYETRIYNICLRLLKKPDEAYDAAQEVCIKIWRQLQGFKGESKFSTWVYRVTTNTCLDLLRQQKKVYDNINLVDEGGKLSETIDTEKTRQWKDLSSHMVDQEVTKLLWNSIQSLKEEYRVVIILRDIEGYSYEEIAKCLSISNGTVKSRISRARANLKKILEQNQELYADLLCGNRR